MTLQLGRRPPKNAPALRLADVLATRAPSHPRSEDYLGKLTGWQMLGNDQYGDCVAVTWANVRRLLTAELTGREQYPTIDEVIALYKTQNPGFPAEDNGMDIQTCLEYLVKVGDVLAFAKVDHTKISEVKAALAIFGFVWTGINVQQAQMGQFDAGKPWQYVAGSPLEGGHSVITGGYSASRANEYRFITWAQETGFAAGFWSRMVEEAWVVVFPEHLGTTQFQQGIDLAKLRVAYQAITGRALAA